MTFLPIVERELRMAARRRGTYGMRVKTGILGTLVFAGCFGASQVNPSVTFGKTLFTGLSWLCLVYCLAAGRLMTADCLTREKREGTLGLLFLTDLKGYDVVLGKLAVTSLDGFYGLLVVLPILAVPILDGGMTNGELWRTTLVLVVTFLFSATVGLRVSAVCRDQRTAMAANLALLLLLAGMPSVVGAIGMMVSRGTLAIDPFYYSCPVYAFLQCSDSKYHGAPHHFWWPITILSGLAILLVFFACRAAPRCWQDKPVSPRAVEQKPGRRRKWWAGRAVKATAFRRSLLEVNAYYWLAGRPYLKYYFVWACMICLGGWWFLTNNSIGYVDSAANFGVAFLLNSTLKLWLITEAGHQLAADKKSGAFELLLSTPLSAADMIRGQRLALRRQFLKPAIVAIVFELILIFSVRHIHLQESIQEAFTWGAGIFMFVADMMTLSWVAMAAALVEKSHDRATIKTTAKIMALPWILWQLVCGLTYFWGVLATNGQGWDPSWPYFLAWWFGLGIVVDIVFLLMAKRSIQASFRKITLDEVSPKFRFGWLLSGPKEAVKQSIPHPGRRRRLAFAGIGLLIMAASAAIYAKRVFRVHLPDPVLVSINQNHQGMQVCPDHNGFLFVMPDGSLWQWKLPQGKQTAEPQQIGTDRDWVQATMAGLTMAGLRSNGTLWEWSEAKNPSQVGGDTDWANISANSKFIFALKRNGTLWKGGAQGMKKLGANNDWKAISSRAAFSTTLVLRSNGTLWTLGDFVYSTGGIWTNTSNSLPVQLCQESNWVSLGDSFWSGARNQTGECWTFYPMHNLPGDDLPVASLGQLASEKATAIALGPFFTENWAWARYELRPDGTIWVTPLTMSWPLTANGATVRFGERSDWTSLWGGTGTLIGQTSDGTLWTWGLDYGQERHYDFSERLSLARTAVSNAIGSRVGSLGEDEWQGHQPQKVPRPLIRFVGATGAK